MQKSAKTTAEGLKIHAAVRPEEAAGRESAPPSRGKRRRRLWKTARRRGGRRERLSPGDRLLRDTAIACALLLGVLTTLTCFFLFPLFPGVSVVFASRQQVLSRSLTIGVLLLSSALSLAFIGVLSLMKKKKKKG